MTAPVFRLPDRPIRVAPPGSGIWAGPLFALSIAVAGTSVYVVVRSPSQALSMPILLLIFLGAQIAWTGRHLRQVARTRRALDGQHLRTVPLRLEREDWLGSWIVSHRRPDGSVARATWSVGRAWPIQLGSTPGDIVGVTAGDGLVAMPLDAKLSWLVLSEEERAALLAALQTG